MQSAKSSRTTYGGDQIPTMNMLNSQKEHFDSVAQILLVVEIKIVKLSYETKGTYCNGIKRKQLENLK